MKKIEENSNGHLDEFGLSLDYGEVQAKKHIRDFKKFISNKINNKSEELKEEFIEEMKITEKQESHLIKDLNSLFD